MAAQLDLEAVLTADARVWIKETQRAATSFNNLAKTVQTQSTKTQNRLAKLAKFAKGTLAVAIGFSLSRQIMKTAGSLKRLGKEAVFSSARVEQMTSVLNMLGQGLGYSTREMAGFTEEIRKSGIEMGIAQNTLQEFIRYEMDLTQSTKLAQVAQDAAVMSNSNSSETLQRLIYGISRQNSLILRNAGIQVMAGVAIDKHAASLNKATDQLTSNERTQAVLNAVLKEGTKIQGAYTKSLEEPIKKLGSLQRIWDDISGQLGDTLYPAFKVFINDIWDPYVKWLKKVTAEGTRVNNSLSDFGLAAAAAFTELARFAETDVFKEISGNVIAIADSFLEIFKSMRPLTTMLVNMQTFGAAVKILAGTLEALSKAAVVLAPLLVGLFTLKMVAAAQAMTAALVYQVRIRAMLYAETLRMAAAEAVHTAVLTGATVATRGMTLATVGLSAAMKTILPLFAAFLAFKAVTAIISSFQTRESEAEEATERLNAALYDQHQLVDNAGDAFKAYLDNTSRFANRNQIDDLNDLANAVGLTRQALVQLLEMPNQSGMERFVQYMTQMGGKNGLIAATEAQLIAIKSRQDVYTESLQESAAHFGHYVDEQGKIWQGNADLIISFGLESDAVQAAAENNIKWLARAGGQQTDWLSEVLRTVARAEGAFNKFDPSVVSLETLFAIGLKKHGGDWVEFTKFLTVEMGKLEEEFLDAAEAAKREADRIEELSQKARKLSGSIEELTGDMQKHWFSVVENNEAYKGFLERLGEVSERYEIFNSDIFNAIDAAQAQEDITKSLTAILEENKDAVGGQGTAIAAVMNLMRTKAIPAATKFVKSQVHAAEALNQTVDPAQLLNEALAVTALNFTETAKQAGFLEEDIQNLINTMFGINDVPIEVKFVTDLYGAFNVDTIKKAIGELAQTIIGRSTDLFKNLTTILQGLMPTADRVTGAMGQSLRTMADLEDIITGHITEQNDRRQKGLRLIMRYRRALMKIDDIEENIDDLLDDRNKALKIGGKFQLQQENSLLRQERSVRMLQRAFDSLTQQKEDMAVGATETELETELKALKLQASQVTDIEEELIKTTEMLTRKQAKNGDITAVEAAEIENLWIEMKAAERQYGAGIISQIQYKAAQQRVTDAIREALLPSQRIKDVTAELSNVRAFAETIDLDLAIAENELKIATIEQTEALAGNTAEQAVGIAMAKEAARIDRVLYDETLALAAAKLELTDSEYELAKSGVEVAEVLTMIRGENALLGTELEAAFDKHVVAMHDAMVAVELLYKEFVFLQELMDAIELAGLTPEQIDQFVTSVEEALDKAQGVLDSDQLIALIRNELDDAWNVDLDKWKDALQTAIDAWNLTAIIEIILGEMPAVPNVDDFMPPPAPKPQPKPDPKPKPKPQPKPKKVPIPPVFKPAPTSPSSGFQLDPGEKAGGFGFSPSAYGPDAATVFDDEMKAIADAIAGAAGFMTKNELMSDIEKVSREQAVAGEITNRMVQERLDATQIALDAGHTPWEISSFLASLAPSAATGGIVKRDTLANVHAGEAIIPLKGGGGMGTTYNINVGAGISDPTAVSEAVVEALRAYERGNGPIPVTTTASMYTASS